MAKRLKCRWCMFSTNDTRAAMDHVIMNDGHIVHGPGKERGTTLTIETTEDVDEL